ncbi:MAG TPA: cell division protein FtsI [Opitutae bacterium]|nr:cell division protein FtsI [Opitutae bacterium]
MNDLLRRTAQLLETQLATDPDNFKLKFHLVEVLSQLGERESLFNLLDAALIVALCKEPDLFDTLIRSLAANSPQDALTILNQALEQDKSNALFYWRKAEIMELLEEPEQAAKFRSVACVIDEDFETTPPPALLNTQSEEPEKPQLITHQGVYDGPDDGLPSDDDMAQVNELLASFDNGKRSASFKDVGGMESLKNQVRMKILLPFEKPELFKKFRKNAGGGVLLYGPPGCGKTLLARAAAGEANLFFGSLGIPEVLSKWIGESEQRVHQFFETARRQSPSLLFIDEIDALGGKRSEASASMSTLVNVLLTEIDGATSNNENVFVIAATNMPWRVDSAFRRPGRFDQVIFVPPPDFEARITILDLYLQDMPTETIDTKKIAKVTAKFSGADLEALISATAEDALLEEMNTGKSQLITTQRLLKRAKQQRPTTLEWLEQATNYASFANSSGLYDDLAKYLDEL